MEINSKHPEMIDVADETPAASNAPYTSIGNQHNNLDTAVVPHKSKAIIASIAE